MLRNPRVIPARNPGEDVGQDLGAEVQLVHLLKVHRHCNGRDVSRQVERALGSAALLRLFDLIRVQNSVRACEGILTREQASPTVPEPTGE